MLKQYNVFIAGGMITSLFTRADINDVDIYFRSKADLARFLYEEMNHNWVLSQTKKAFLFKVDGKALQTIYFRFFEDAEQIFDTFDFTVCMGTYDFATEEFVLHPDFLKHNAQRMLKFNANTAFPLISALRVEKYKNKGYYISKPEFMRILLMVQNLEISDYDALERQMGGMYGESYEHIFQNQSQQDFSIASIVDRLKDLTVDDKCFDKPFSFQIDDWTAFVYKILGEKIKYFEHKGCGYRIAGGSIERVGNTAREEYERVNVEDVITFPLTRYKYVQKLPDGTYRSYYDSSYEWKLGENRPKSSFNGGLFGCTGSGIRHAAYADQTDRAVLELEIHSIEDVQRIQDITRDSCSFNRVFVIREVPLNEIEDIEARCREVADDLPY